MWVLYEHRVQSAVISLPLCAAPTGTQSTHLSKYCSKITAVKMYLAVKMIPQVLQEVICLSRASEGVCSISLCWDVRADTDPQSLI